jgi:hypothetical protein
MYPEPIKGTECKQSFMRGWMTVKKVNRAIIIDDDLVLQEKWLTLYTDVMHVDSQQFLITVCDLL